MTVRSAICGVLFLAVPGVGAAAPAVAGDACAVNLGADLYSRYIWRGLDIAGTPSVQPSLSVACSGVELGVWGAYTLSNGASESDEVDFWLGYGRELGGGISLSALLTDYTFPNAGVDFFNFNNYDAVRDDSIPDPGAHTLELGLSVTGPESFPLTVSGSVNIYNDAGNNTYFELDYPVFVQGTELTLTCGATAGSADNPDYYGADNFAVIDLEVLATRSVALSETHSLPLTVGFILNPRAETANILVGVTF